MITRPANTSRQCVVTMYLVCRSPRPIPVLQGGTVTHAVPLESSTASQKGSDTGKAKFVAIRLCLHCSYRANSDVDSRPDAEGYLFAQLTNLLHSKALIPAELPVVNKLPTGPDAARPRQYGKRFADE